MLVAVHPWDTQGAKASGLQAAYLNRGGASPFPPYYAAPDLELTSLSELPKALGL